MKKFLLILTCLLGFSAAAWAETYETPDITAAKTPFTLDGTSVKLGQIGNQDVTWNYVIDWGNVTGTNKYLSCNWASSGNTWYGYQFGKKDNAITSLTLSTTAIPGNITKIEVITKASESADTKYYTLTASVGSGENVTSLGTQKVPASDNQTLTFTPEQGTTVSGKVELKWENNGSTKYVAFKKIKITYTTSTNPDLQDPQLEFNPKSVEYTIGYGDFPTPTLSMPEGVTVTYASSNTGVATVAETTGVVTIVAAGETTITATSAANATYAAGTASYTITVSEPAQPSLPTEGVVYKLVENTNDLTAGDTFIITSVHYTGTNKNPFDKYFALSTTQNTNNRAGIEINAPVNGKIVNPSDDVEVFTLVDNDGTLAIQTHDGKYLQGVSGKNQLNTASEVGEATAVTIEIEGTTEVKFTQSERHIQVYVTISGGDITNVVFSTYATNQTGINIYKLVEHTYTFHNEELSDAHGENHIAGSEGNWVANRIKLHDGVDHVLPVDVKTKEVEYIRNLTNTNWSAICLPFAVDANTLTDYDVIALKGLSTDGTAIEFEYVTEMTAHNPYLIRKKTEHTDRTVSITLTEDTPTIDVKAAAEATHTQGAVSLIGIYEAQPIPAGDFGLAGGEFKKSAEGNTNKLKAFRAYLHFTTAQQSLRMKIVGGESGIESIEAVELQDGDFYDLQGRKVENPNTGVYIFNGMKVYIK